MGLSDCIITVSEKNIDLSKKLYTIAFVYSDKERIVLKGRASAIEEWLKDFKSKGNKYIVNMSYYSNGIELYNRWVFWHNDFVIFPRGMKKYNKLTEKWHYIEKWEIRPRLTSSITKAIAKKHKLNLKRLPPYWIPEYDNIVENFNKYKLSLIKK